MMTKALRPGKVFIDWSQNSRHKTTVAAVLAAGPTRADRVDAGDVGRGQRLRGRRGALVHRSRGAGPGRRHRRSLRAGGDPAAAAPARLTSERTGSGHGTVLAAATERLSDPVGRFGAAASCADDFPQHNRRESSSRLAQKISSIPCWTASTSSSIRPAQRRSASIERSSTAWSDAATSSASDAGSIGATGHRRPGTSGSWLRSCSPGPRPRRHIAGGAAARPGDLRGRRRGDHRALEALLPTRGGRRAREPRHHLRAARPHRRHPVHAGAAPGRRHRRSARRDGLHHGVARPAT